MSKRKLSSIDTLVGANTKVTGDILFSGGLHVEGHIEGNVISERDTDSVLTVAEQGFIRGSVCVPTIVLGGKVNGDVTAYGRVELGETARVEGNVYYDTMKMAEGAEINGSLIHQEKDSVHSIVPTASSNDDSLQDVIELKVK